MRPNTRENKETETEDIKKVERNNTTLKRSLKRREVECSISLKKGREISRKVTLKKRVFVPLWERWEMLTRLNGPKLGKD